MPHLADAGASPVSPTIAAQVLWHFEGPAPPSLKPGDFIASLIDTIARADPQNRMLLARGFPGYVTAVTWAQNFTAGIAELRVIARNAGSSITCPVCSRTSHHPEDVRQGFCGHCHQWTSPPFGAADDRQRGLQLDTFHCDRCGSDVPRVMWRGDDHAVIVTRELVFEEGAAMPGGVEFLVAAPAEMVPCSRVDWSASRR